MESNYISQTKRDYAKLLLQNGETERSREIAFLDDYEPIYTFRGIHEQELPKIKDHNEMILEAYTDINALIIGYRDVGNKLNTLMTTTKARLEDLETRLAKEREKLIDTNILCNKYTDFSSVLELDNTNLFGEYHYEDGVICNQIVDHQKTAYRVSDIDGNGYEGNDYVLTSDNKLLSKTVKTNNRGAINDNSIISAFEYSRITASSSEKEVTSAINFDSTEARMSISLVSTTDFNKVTIKCSTKDTILTSAAISTDGISYKTILSTPIVLSDDSIKYEDLNYLSSSGLLCFPSTKYLKLFFESNATTNEKIGFEKTKITEEKQKAKSIMPVTVSYVYDDVSQEIFKSVIE